MPQAKLIESLTHFLLYLYVSLRFCIDSISVMIGGSMVATRPSLNWLPPVIIAAAFLLFTISLRAKAQALVVRRSAFLFALFSLYCVLATIWSAWKLGALTYSVNLVGISLFLIIISNIGDEERSAVYACIASLLLISAALGLYQHYAGYQGLHADVDIFGTSAGDAERRIEERAPLGFFSYPNTFACAMLVFACICSGIFTGVKKGFLPMGFFAATGVAALLNIVNSGSRAAMALAGIAAVYFISKKRIVLAAGAAVFLILPMLLKIDTVAQRILIWDSALKCIVESAGNAVAGVGIMNFGDHYVRFRHAQAEETIMAHNDYLQLVTESGLIGAVILACLLITTTSARFKDVRIYCSVRLLPLSGIFAGLYTAATVKGVFGPFESPLLTAVLGTLAGGLAFSALRTAGLSVGGGVSFGVLCLVALHSFYEFNLYNLGFLMIVCCIFILSTDEKSFAVRLKGAYMCGAVICAAAAVFAAVTYAYDSFRRADSLKQSYTEDRSTSKLLRAASFDPMDAWIFEQLALVKFNEASRMLAAHDSSESGKINGILMDALSYFRRASAIRPAPFHFFYMGVSFFNLGSLGPAEQDTTGGRSYLSAAKKMFARATEMYPSKPLYWYWSGKASLALSDNRAANECFEKALRLSELVPEKLKRLRLDQAQENEIRGFLTQLQHK